MAFNRIISAATAASLMLLRQLIRLTTSTLLHWLILR
jgi:hypothetical protein